METNRQHQLKQATIISLFLFAAIIATTGVVGLIPQGGTKEGDPLINPTEETVQVMAVIPEQETVFLFEHFKAPLTGRISSAYGYRTDPFTGEIGYHRGVDIAVPEGTEVLASETGTVIASTYDEIGGNYIILAHKNGTKSYYGHLQNRIVSKGDEVEQGQVIGLSGATGKVTGAHLHFQLIYQERTVDPLNYIDLGV